MSPPSAPIEVRVRRARRLWLALLASASAGVLLEAALAFEFGARGGAALALIALPAALTLALAAVLGCALAREHARWRERIEHAERERAAAAESERNKNRFLAHLGHEIRTPLNGLLGSAEFLLDSPLEPEQRQALHAGLVCGRTLLALADDLKDFAELESGALKIESVEGSLRDALDDVLDMLGDTAALKGLELYGGLEEGVPALVHCDPLRVRQVLLNLGNYAIASTAQGRVQLRAALVGAWTSNGRIRFEARADFALPPETRAALFRLEAGTDGLANPGGTLLSLAIAQRLVLAMQGAIGVDEAGAQSTVLWVELPVPKAATGAEALPAAAEQLAGARVLLVDAHEGSCKVLEQTLSRLGCAVRASAEAAQALDLVTRATAPWPIVLLDLELPGIDGLALGKALREKRETREAVLVLLTQRRDSALAESARSAGFDACLAKPARAELLASCLASLLDKRRGARAKPVQTIREGEACILVGGRRQARVLVAEDNPVNQRVIQRMLMRHGCVLEMADTGWAALRALEAGEFDLVLMDCQMPEMDGYAAAAEWRAREAQGKRVPIVALTANALHGDRERCLSVGMDDYLSKPVQDEALQAMLARWLPRETQGARAA